MSHHAPPPPSEVFPAFESACGRPGCPHIFRYKGAKPFDAIAVLLKAHKPHCVGRDIGCPIGWQPTTGMMEKFSGAGCAEETPALGLARLIDEGSEDSQEEHPEPKELSDDVVCADQPSWDVGWKSYGASTHELPAAEEDAEMASFLCESTSADPEPSLTQPRNHEEARHGDNEATMYDFVVPTEIQAAGWTTPLQRAQSTATTMWLGKKTSDTVMVSSYCELRKMDRNECAEPPHGGQVPRCEGQVLSDSGVEIAATKSSARRVAPASKAPSVETMMQGTTAESDTETYCSFRSTCAEKTKSQRGSEARHCDNQGIVTDFGFGETAFDSPNSAPYTMPAATTTQISGGKKTAHTVAERKATLENDVWTGLVEPKRVVCRGCGKTIRLDKRSCYYPGLWLKHRERCDRIKNGISLPHSVLSWTEVEDELLETKYDSRMARASKSVPNNCCIFSKNVYSWIIGGEISGQTALHPNHRVLAGREIRKNISSLTRTAPQYVFRFWHPLGALEAWNIRKYQEDSRDIRLELKSVDDVVDSCWKPYRFRHPFSIRRREVGAASADRVSADNFMLPKGVDLWQAAEFGRQSPVCWKYHHVFNKLGTGSRMTRWDNGEII
ncbi:hypothetical protein B0H11DRAFT_2201641 [Mycena galericulata]|nr:hypothetical protein B0H11DRAFT_2201641 [Mycena galericulata]